MAGEGPRANGFGSDNMYKKPLAIDPNLIRPAPSSASPSADSDNEHKSEQNQPSTGMAQPLVNNPYEIFGNMPLDQLIPLILQSRGTGTKFADLTEESLMEEIIKDDVPLSQAQRDADGDLDMDVSQFANEPGQQTPEPQQIEGPARADEDAALSQEKFRQLKASTVQSLNLAVNESSLALEFVSLLLSSVRPSAANASMSPFLKKTVPQASLNAEKIPFQTPSSAEVLDRSLIAKGWKQRSLEESRTLLKDSYQALEKSLKKEHSYWSKVSHNISKKDVVFRIKDRETGEKSLGIKYGYEDSGSTYTQERGIAVLKHNSKLDRLELVPADRQQANALGKDNNEKFVRVRIFTKIEEEDDYILTGESRLDELLIPNQAAGEEFDFRRQISRLKFFIFEKDLMYQLKRESENLISYGVSIENENKITIEFSTEKLELETMPVNDDVIMNHQQDAPKTDDRKATLVLIMLRMLLVVIYKKQLRKKLLCPQTSMGASVKSPKTHKAVGKLQDNEVLLLRPIIGKFKHESYVNLLKKIIKGFVLDVVEDSSVRKVSGSSHPVTIKNEAVYDNHIAKLDKEIHLFDKILEMPRSDLLVELPKSGTILFVLQSSNYCNATTGVKYTNGEGEILFDTSFSNFKELEDFLHFIVSEYVAGGQENGVKDE
ncbi:LAQU0S20e00914g1_1 [Lachancea quebecensis]|uniref:Mediator of RNA polymerase II transcription subunit 17 n=1 Tax=Lachancea quebecensis TaxID=1654605 RepID=A0A0P1KXE5_9SACH|nr:LAQU0S20e00914g1_1 [Lachancea quebecensis]